jgi:hypothetical protein
MGQADGANYSEIKTDRPMVSRLTFIEDFTLEHSLPGGHIVSIDLSVYAPVKKWFFGTFGEDGMGAP